MIIFVLLRGAVLSQRDNKQGVLMKIIMITGGSASGKSTVSDLLSNVLACPVLKEDDYYHDNAATPGFDPARFDFDDISARDHALLVMHLKALKQGQAVDRPCYCFKSHSRQSRTIRLLPTSYIVLEGMHLLCHEEIRQLVDYSIYIDVPDDVRLSRRLLRDVRERQRSIESVIDQYLSSVRPAHLKLIAPSKQYADFILQPALDGEIKNVLLDPVLKALHLVELY